MNIKEIRVLISVLLKNSNLSNKDIWLFLLNNSNYKKTLNFYTFNKRYKRAMYDEKYKNISYLKDILIIVLFLITDLKCFHLGNIICL